MSNPHHKTQIHSVYLLRESMLQHGHTSATVTSNSMAPLLLPGDRVEIVPTQFQYLRPGDLIVIQVENDLIVHRYWRSQEAKERLFLVTKGDRLNQFDPLMPVESFIGQVMMRYRNQKVMTLLNPPGLQMNKLLYHLLRFAVKVKGPSLPKNDRVKTDRIGANVESTEKSGSNALNFLIYSLTHIVVGFTEFFANKNARPD